MAGDGSRGPDGAVADFESLFPASEFDGWPAEVLETDLRGLLGTGPESVSWLAAPTGRALGYRVAAPDDHDAFVGELVDQVRRMLGPNAGDVLDGLVDGPGDRLVELEHVFGDPNWYRVGLSFDDFDDLRNMLLAMNAPEHARDRAMRYEDVEDASLQGFSLVVVDQRNWTYATSAVLAPSVEDRPTDDAVGDGPVSVERTVRDWRATWIRRPAPSGDELAEWESTAGLDEKETGTPEEVHDALGIEGPDFLAWQRSDPAGTATYVYEDPVDLD
ncbi:hypothetical protein BRD00_15275 [Halobacteriales archaeon QS_8_69_26]|nr:MAG: hypothetical protein BRD00_15275 [Halobacteriales archaeon QS_8_69_26]